MNDQMKGQPDKQKSQKGSAGRKVWLPLAMGLGVLLLLGGVSFLPAISLERKGMQVLEGVYVTLYYETEEAAAREVFALMEAESVRIAQKLAFAEPPHVCCYVYDKQSTFQTKKYGYAALLLGLDWYVGDNRGTNVLLTSPARPGRVHRYEDIKETSLHELTHAYHSLLNPDMPLWVNEGVALYLTNGSADRYFFQGERAPTLAQMRSSNPLVFSGAGGYTFAYTYVEYLDQTYGWDQILVLLRTGDYASAFGRGEEEIYDGWVTFLQERYG